MKKFARSTLLCFIPIVTGVVCFIVGNILGNNTVSYVGMLSIEVGLPAMMVIFLIIGLILMSMGKLSDGGKSGADTAEEEVLSQREREQKAIDAVNGTSHFESRVNMANYEIQSVAEGMKNAPKWGIVVGITGFFLLVADLVVATVLLINRIFIGAIMCAVIFGVVIITALVGTIISRAKAMNGDISKAEKITEGKVKTCFMVGTTTTKSGGLPYGNAGTVRINSVTYRVIVIADGVEYDAFSKRFYETDENVTIAVMGKKRAKIVEDAETEKPYPNERRDSKISQM